MRVIAALSSCFLVLGLGIIPSQARAEEARAAEAEVLFQRGVELMKADDCSDAVPEFLTSQNLDPSSATLLNLGTCYARLGRKATAFKTYRQAASAAQAEKNEALHERAVQAMALLGPSLTKLQIVTPSGTMPLVVRINGELVENYDGLPIPLDPGESVIEAAAPGREPWRKKVTADDLGATLVIQVPELAPARPPPAPSVAAENTAPDWRVPAVITAGAGVAAIVAGSVFGISAQRAYDDSLHHCDGDSCTQAGIDLRDDARRKATVSTWAFGLGAVAVATGVVLWVVHPGPSSRNKATTRVELRANIDSLMLEVIR
jgi:hypothetical protein